MINNIIDILNYNFFQNALIFWSLISILFAVLWVFVVSQKNANITHTIWNLSFLWIVIGLFLGINTQITLFVSCVLWSILIWFIKKNNVISNESSMEISAQIFLALSIIIITQINWYKANISNYLFGDILAITTNDLLFTIVLYILLSLFLYFNYKNLIKIIFSQEIAKSQNVKIDWINVLFLLILSFCISVWIKILWILLIWSYIVLPSNISKFYSKNFKQFIILSVIVSILATVSWLFVSYIFDIPVWPWIIIIFWVILVFTLIVKKIF